MIDCKYFFYTSQPTIKYINNINRMTKIKINVRFVISLLLLILLMNLLISFSNSSILQEGLGQPVETPPKLVKINLTDKTKTKTDPNPVGKYNIYTEYDPDKSAFAMNNDESVSLIIADNTKLTIEPSTTNPDKKSHKADIFPKKFSLSLQFDKSSPVYYLESHETMDKSIENSLTNHELKIIKVSMGGLIMDANYQKLGSITVDPKNPRLYNLNIENSEDIHTIVFKFTTSTPDATTKANKATDKELAVANTTTKVKDETNQAGASPELKV